MNGSASLLLLTLLVPSLSAAQAVSEDAFAEAMAVCDNMTLYVDAAKRDRLAERPLISARAETARLMETNLRMDAAVKQGAITLAQRIYDFVYSQELLSALSTERVLAATCGTYRDYNLPAERVKEHVFATTQSAWDPLARVPLCTKIAQSAANIASGREKGIGRDKMTEVATSSLASDAFTLPRIPTLVAWAYDHPELPVSSIYAYAIQHCNQQRAGKQMPTLAELKDRLQSCGSKSSPQERAACTMQAIRSAQ
jgi:hypothetical protein